MRAVFATLLFVTACSADIAPGTYLCGPEELCPDGLVCNGVDNICVNSSKQQPFTCADFNEIPGDDAPATAQDIGELPCVSLVRETKGCLPAGDVGDFYTFRVAAGCTSARISASVVYPIAFQSLTMQLGKAGETPTTIDKACPSSRAVPEGDGAACLDAPVTSGTWVLGVIPDGTGTCDGECKYNRYGFAMQISQ
jgi:hypothetical protein